MSSNPQYGKGSKPRPFSVKADEFASNWKAAFGNKKTKRQSPAKTLPEPCAANDEQAEFPLT